MTDSSLAKPPLTAAIWLLLLLLPACGRYGEFTLPAPEGKTSSAVPVWEPRPEPVLGRGVPGDWDATDALNPSVVRDGKDYHNFYSGYDGSVWRTGLATSADGVVWAKQGVVLEPDPTTWEGSEIAANGSAIRTSSEFLYWYQSGDPHRIGLARSADGRSWRKEPKPVLDLGPRGSWDEMAVADPYVVQAGDRYYMYYLGQDRARRQRLGVAVSGDGAVWTKLRSNPILELGGYGAFDENGLGEPAVWAAHARYWMLYTGRDRAENRKLGFAVSPDGIRWERLPASTVIGGGQAWNAKVLCDPAVEVTPSGVRVWFGGGDIASPDQNLNGQVGLGLLRWRDATLAE